MRRLVLAAVLSAAAAGPAAACLNDTELPGREREFRSQYKVNTPPPPPPSDSQPGDQVAWLNGTALAAGVVLLLGAVAVTFRKPAAG